MKKYFVVVSVVVLALTVCLITPSAALAAPARPEQGDICFVQDANLVQYVVPCKFHQVLKTDANGNVIGVLVYQDKAQLPPEAALPDHTVQSVIHVDCGCIFDGDYLMTLTPSGHYESQGPINNN